MFYAKAVLWCLLTLDAALKVILYSLYLYDSRRSYIFQPQTGNYAQFYFRLSPPLPKILLTVKSDTWLPHHTPVYQLQNKQLFFILEGVKNR